MTDKNDPLDFEKTLRDARSEIQDASLGELPSINAERAVVGRVDRYELIEKLGQGGFGAVYRARDTEAGVEVALKALPPLISHSPDEMQSVRTNFALVSKLVHSGIANLKHLHRVENPDEASKTALGVSVGDYLVVMEYVPGSTLSAWRTKFPNKQVPVFQALEICRQISEALDYAHSQKIIHRDIKPSNVMISMADNDSLKASKSLNSLKSAGDLNEAEGHFNERSDSTSLTVKILDFGLAAEIRSSMSRVSQEQGDSSGTRPYMAPEQWTGRRQGAQTDQYALAVLFYELVSGAVPFQSVFETGDMHLMRDVVKSEPVEPLDELDHKQNTALLKALSKEPAERYASCIDFINALAGGKAHGAWVKRSPQKSASRFARASQDKKGTKKIWVGVCGLAVIAAAYLSYTSYQTHQAEEVQTTREQAGQEKPPSDAWAAFDEYQAEQSRIAQEQKAAEEQAQTEKLQRDREDAKAQRAEAENKQKAAKSAKAEELAKATKTNETQSVGKSIASKRIGNLQLQQLKADRISARVEMLVAKARYEQMDELIGEDFLTASAYVANDPFVETMRTQIKDYDEALKSLLENYGSNHPEVRETQAARDELVAKLGKALDGIKKGLRAQYIVAKAKYEALDEELRAGSVSPGMSAEHRQWDETLNKDAGCEQLLSELKLLRNVANSLKADARDTTLSETTRDKKRILYEEALLQAKQKEDEVAEYLTDSLEIRTNSVGGTVLQWSAEPGCLYDIYWAPDLLDEFKLLASNQTGGVFTSPHKNGYYELERKLPSGLPEPGNDRVSPSKSPQTYIVQKGDTLSAIAAMYGTSWKKLAEYNNLENPNKFYVGQIIKIPPGLSASAPVVGRPSLSTVARDSEPITQGSSYVIQMGDTLAGIAKRAGLSVEEIQVANALTSRLIIVGKSLSIPCSGDIKFLTVDNRKFVSVGNRLECRNLNGQLLWAFRLDEQITTAPVCIGDGVFIGTDEKIYCLDVDTGAKQWFFHHSDGSIAALSVIFSNRIKFSSQNYEWVLDAKTGKQLSRERTL